MKDTRELSRKNWNGENALEAINTGSLQRIADATEKMASNYIQLQNDRDMYKRWYDCEKAEKEALYRKVSALKGVITKLKKRK